MGTWIQQKCPSLFSRSLAGHADAYMLCCYYSAKTEKAEQLIEIVKILDRTQRTYIKNLSMPTINLEEVMKYICYLS